MSGLSVMYVTGSELEDYFVSNQTGEALANGLIYFYVDSNRTQAKTVYELNQGSGFPPSYTYTPLPNPIVLSNTGTIMDANGNNVALYYYPYDTFGNVQLYYIEVYDAFGNLQFTREAWPYPNLPVASAVTTVTASLPLGSSGGTTPNIFVAEAIPVSLGGTGVTSLSPPYGVICAGTSTINPVQVISSLGTTGQVLTSNGESTLPSWQASGGGGNWVYISQVTASASPTISFTGLSNAYLHYRIILCNVLMASVDNLIMLTSANNGSSYDTGASNYAWNIGYFVASSVGGNYSSGDTSINLTALTSYGVSATPGYTMQGFIDIMNPSAANYCNILTDLGGAMFFGSNTPSNMKGWGARLNAAAVNAVRIQSVGGANIASGTFTLYGIST